MTEFISEREGYIEYRVDTSYWDHRQQKRIPVQLAVVIDWGRFGRDLAQKTFRSKTGKGQLARGDIRFRIVGKEK